MTARISRKLLIVLVATLAVSGIGLAKLMTSSGPAEIGFDGTAPLPIAVDTALVVPPPEIDASTTGRNPFVRLDAPSDPTAQGTELETDLDAER